AQQLQQQLPDIQFYLPISLQSYQQQIEATVKSYGLQVNFIKGSALTAIAAADLAITKSGTVNLEIALLNVPQVILYRVSPLTMWVARKILKFDVRFISPPNLLLEKASVPELLQETATPDRICQESLDILLNPEIRQHIFEDYQQLRAILGEPGVCDRAAQAIFDFAPKK
ncbi:MAG: lipid-A-disaccharide synthase, partial [Microcystaceae cyanobacterium]